MKLPKEKKQKEEKQPKGLCNDCDDRKCNKCSLKVKLEKDKLNRVSLSLINHMKNKWMTTNEKLQYLEDLQTLIVDLYTEV